MLEKIVIGKHNLRREFFASEGFGTRAYTFDNAKMIVRKNLPDYSTQTRRIAPVRGKSGKLFNRARYK